MQFTNLITAAAIGLTTFASAAVQGREPENALVIVQHLAGVSTSTVYSTSKVTVWACDSSVTDCPVGSSTNLVSVVTSVVPVSTTICPLTVTSVTTSGTPGTGSAPLSTTTVTSTAYSFDSETSAVQTAPASSGPAASTAPASSGPAASTGITSSGAASSYASTMSGSSGSPVSSSPAPPGVPAQSSGDSTIQSTLHSTITRQSTVTVPGETLSSGLSSVAGSSIANATEASSSASSMPPAPPAYGPPAQVTSVSSNEAGGVTASGTGYMTPSTNGTLATPTLGSPSETFVPFTGGAAAHDIERMMVCLVIAVGSAVLLV
ncbi:Ca2+-modulated nonselective cation channel polycystin [Zymoseptoria tritici IPO323]|uniref:Ca2+-modulated nonselective cation channel polycystin n=1 Tax=Zymoseptoria tritici (strain CBS 115943 / IPO323) TaxID=336722 RepID=F9XN84_ZYMTI|nr:Ca2+-modulated nonselective cation channel polycystin [Zymoseptoria tritici IPO323]EGP83559.1 Ca2+-modulated nonselective cation channel polycystin [Zymoseptoria tritici IPO323]